MDSTNKGVPQDILYHSRKNVREGYVGLCAPKGTATGEYVN